FDPRYLSWTLVSPDFHSPYSQQWSFGIQRQIGRNHVAEVRYVGNRGVGLFQTLNRNPFINRLVNGFTSAGAGGTSFTFPGFPNLATGFTPNTSAQCVPTTAADTTNAAACVGRIIPGRSQVRMRANTGSSTYNSLQMRYNGRLTNQLTWGA